jgi:hypothetical protein
LTPEIEITASPPIVTPNKPRTKKVLLAVLVIAVALTSLAALSVIPNQFVKNRIWMSIEGISISSIILLGNPTTDFILIVGIHNPTHQAYRVEVTNADLDANITGVRAQRFHSSRGFPYIYANDSWTDLTGSTELQACYPILMGLDFISSASLPSSSNNGTFLLTLMVRINGSQTTFTNNWTTSFAAASQTTSTSATTTSITETYKPPNECVLPWL